MKTFFCIGIFSLLLAACSADVTNTLSQASAADNPVKALTIVRQALHAYLDKCNYRCDAPEELTTADQDYFVKAAKAGDEGVLRELFTQRDDLDDLKNELKSDVLSRAKDSKNVDLLVAAASIAGNDTLGVINKGQQIQFLKRAWVAGDVKSAGKLAHIYVRVKDYDNAYFWSLRCIQKCDRNAGTKNGDYVNQIELLELEKHLDLTKIAKLQSTSASGSLVE